MKIKAFYDFLLQIRKYYLKKRTGAAVNNISAVKLLAHNEVMV